MRTLIPDMTAFSELAIEKSMLEKNNLFFCSVQQKLQINCKVNLHYAFVQHLLLLFSLYYFLLYLECNTKFNSFAEPSGSV